MTFHASFRRALPLALTLALAGLAAQAHAQGGWQDAQSDRVDARQDLQADRIRQGVASGELTRPETARLVEQQRHIRRLERRTEADGQVTAREAARLRRDERFLQNLRIELHYLTGRREERLLFALAEMRLSAEQRRRISRRMLQV